MICQDNLEAASIEQLQTRDDMSLTDVKNRGGLIRPSSHMKKLCMLAEQVVRSILNCEGLHKDFINQCLASSLALVHNSYPDLYTTLFCCDHVNELLRTVLYRYIMIRSYYETSKVSSNLNLRSKLSRLVIFNNV